MAVAYDAASEAAVAGGTSLSWNHTCTGINLILLVGVAFGSNTRGVVGITYDGVALTQVAEKVQSTVAKSELWYLLRPSTGENSIAVTQDSGASSAGAASLTGVRTLNPVDTAQTASGNDTTPTVTVTGTSLDLIVDALAAKNNPTVGAGQTQRWNKVQSGTYSAGSTEGGGAGTVMSWTITSANWATIGAAIKGYLSLTLPLMFKRQSVHARFAPML